MNALARTPQPVNTDWRRRLVKPVVPEGEGPGVPLSVRYPKGLLVRIDACAKDTGNSRTETLLHLLRWALDEYETQRAAEKETKRG